MSWLLPLPVAIPLLGAALVVATGAPVGSFSGEPAMSSPFGFSPFM